MSAMQVQTLRTLAPVPVSGAKKGGGGGGTEAKDTLRSTQTASVLDLVSEGPCIGLVNDLKSIYLDGVPAVAQDGTPNIDGVKAEWTSGLIGQASIDDVDGVQAEVAVGIKVTAAASLVRSVTAATSANKVRVTLGIPQLTKQDTSSGDLNGSSVQVAVDLQTNGGGYVQVASRTVDGKCTSRYQFAFLIELTGSGPWDLRVRRVTPDSTSVTVQDEVWWDSYTLISSLSLRYPCSSLVGLKVGAEKFSAIPRRNYDWMGLVVSVPSNYDPYTRKYTGTWDGTFKQAWTNNPAWVFFDMATKKRYGAGRRIDVALLNKWTLYQIGRYCDAVDVNGNYVGVPDGRGGVEPRFTCNVWIVEQKDAYILLQELAALMRACVSWWGGAVDLMQDAPSDAVMLYTPANVVGGAFRYEGTSKGLKKSGCIVWWNDPSNFGKPTPELYQDPDLVAKYGVETMTLKPLGCTSRGQALRMAKWAVYSETHEGMVVRFSVGSEGALSGLGRIIQTSDPIVAGERAGGRILAMTATTVRLDKAMTLAAGTTYTLSLMVADAVDPFKIAAVDRTVTTGAGTTDTLTLSGGVPAGLALGAVWVLKSPALAPQTWRVLRVGEGEKDKDGGTTYEITAVAHNPSKWAYIEQGLKLEQRVVSRLSAAATAPTALVCKESVVIVAGQVSSTATLSWTPGVPGQRYEVSWRHRLGVWTVEAETAANTIDIPNLTAGRLDVSVRAVNVLGARSTPLVPGGAGYYMLLGKDAPPANVANFGVSVSAGQAAFKWDYPDDGDYDVTEIRMVAEGGTWATTPVVFRFNGRADHCPISPYPAIGTYAAFAAHWDTSNNRSLTPQGITVTVTASGITATASGTNELSNTEFRRLRGGMPYPYDPQAWAGYNVLFTLANIWAWEDRPGRDGATGRSIALRAITASEAGGVGGRVGFMTSLTIVDPMAVGGVSNGWQPGETYTVSLWARVWQPGAAAGGSTEADIAYVTGASATGTTPTGTGTINFTLPAVANGVLRVVLISLDDYVAATLAAPAGWTMIGSKQGATGNPDGRVTYAWYRIAAQGDPAALALSVTSGGGFTYSIACAAWSGVDTASPVSVVGAWSAAGASGTTAAAQAITAAGIATTGNTALVWLAAADPPGNHPATNTMSAPAGYTRRVTQWDAGGSSNATIADKLPKAANGATGAVSGSLASGGAGYDAVLIALKPAATGGGASTVTCGLWLNGVNQLVGDRSYMMARISRTTGAVTFSRIYDVWGIGSGGNGAGYSAANLAADLDATGTDNIVVVWTRDSPSVNRLTAGLPAALYRCGATPAIFGSPAWQERCAYVLIGVPGAGAGRAFERYKGAVSSDPTAVIDISFDLVGAAGNLMPVVREGGAHRVVASGFGLTAPANPTKAATAWAGKQTNLYWNQRPAVFTKVASPGITHEWQQYKYSLTWGAVVEGSGNLYWGIGDETGASVLASLPAGAVIEMTEPMVNQGADFPPWEASPGDDLRESSISTFAMAPNASFDILATRFPGPVTYSSAA